MKNASTVMTPARFTVDTNILVYVIDRDAGVKHDLSTEILRRSTGQDCWLTLQSVSEFYSAVTRRMIMDRSAAAAQVEDWLTLFPVLGPSSTAIRAAMAHASADRASYWDGLLVETALEGGCAVVVTEDMHDGAMLGSARICHPFADGKLTQDVESLLQ